MLHRLLEDNLSQLGRETLLLQSMFDLTTEKLPLNVLITDKASEEAACQSDLYVQVGKESFCLAAIFLVHDNRTLGWFCEVPI